MSAEFTVGKHRVGLRHPTYFIADIAANHDGDLNRAKDLIYLGAEAGMDAAKFQNFTARSLVSDTGFRKLGTQTAHQAVWKKSVYEVYDDASLPLEWTEALKETCEDARVDYFTSLYNLDDIEALSPHVCAWKIGSGDITWHEIIERLAQDGKPILLATGASDMDEVEAAVAAARRYSENVVLMQCNTNYSGSVENFRNIQLNVLKTFADAFPDVVLGLSDHTPGHATVLGAVALGARVIEKHFTDDTTREGSDHPFSMDPRGWRDMVDRTRELEAALGGTEKHVMENEKETIVLQRRSVRATRDLPAGTVLSRTDLTVLRPCPEDALAPYRLPELVGKVTLCDIEQGDCVRLGDVE